MPESNDRGRMLAHLRDERDGAELYERVARAEPDPNLAGVYRRMAAVERRHAAAWEEKLRAAGVVPPRFGPSWRTRALGLLARRFGPGLVLPAIAAAERADAARYRGEPDAVPLAADERSHARLLAAAAHGRPGLAGGEIARLEGRHRAAGGNALRAAVLGANDGLMSNLSLVMGVAGAALPARAVLLTGCAGLLAGAGSMALGEWLSVQSSRELYGRQLAIEAAEIAAAPADEAEELALIYMARGVPEDEARRVAARIVEQPGQALETLAREELGIDPAELGGSAWVAAATSFALFALGALVPLAPFVFLRGGAAMAVSLGASGVALFAIGAAITLFTGRGVWFTGGRQVAFGLATAALTWGVGRVLGVAVRG